MAETKTIFEKETSTDFSGFYGKTRTNFNAAKRIAGIKDLVMIGGTEQERIVLEKSQNKLASFELRVISGGFFFDIDIMTLVTSTPKKIAEYITLKVKEVSP
jgi:hypothetical protein